MKTPFSNVTHPTGKLQTGMMTRPGFVQDIIKNLDFVQEKILEVKREKIKRNASKKVSFPIGMTVMVKILPEVRGIKHPRYAGPYKIIQKKGDSGYVLENRDGDRLERNIQHLKPVEKNENTKSKTLTSIETARNERNYRLPNQSIHERRYPTRQRSQPARYGYCMSCK